VETTATKSSSAEAATTVKAAKSAAMGCCSTGEHRESDNDHDP
jgi:hypothetical protein